MTFWNGCQCQTTNEWPTLSRVYWLCLGGSGVISRSVSGVRGWGSPLLGNCDAYFGRRRDHTPICGTPPLFLRLTWTSIHFKHLSQAPWKVTKIPLEDEKRLPEECREFPRGVDAEADVDDILTSRKGSISFTPSYTDGTFSQTLLAAGPAWEPPSCIDAIWKPSLREAQHFFRTKKHDLMFHWYQ